MFIPKFLPGGPSALFSSLGSTCAPEPLSFFLLGPPGRLNMHSLFPNYFRGRALAGSVSLLQAATRVSFFFVCFVSIVPYHPHTILRRRFNTVSTRLILLVELDVDVPSRNNSNRKGAIARGSSCSIAVRAGVVNTSAQPKRALLPGSSLPSGKVSHPVSRIWAIACIRARLKWQRLATLASVTRELSGSLQTARRFFRATMIPSRSAYK